MAVANWRKRMLSIRTQFDRSILLQVCNSATLSVSIYLPTVTISLYDNAKGITKKIKSVLKVKQRKKKTKKINNHEDLRLYCKKKIQKMTCFIKDYAVQWWRCWLRDERWGLVVYCNIGFGCSEKKKSNQINVCNVKQRRIFLRDLTFIRRLYL